MLKLKPNTIEFVKQAFIFVFTLTILMMVIERSIALIPNASLLFFTCDAFENLVFAIMAFTLYYKTFKSKSIRSKIAVVLLFSTILMAFAMLKNYRITDSITLTRSFDYFSSFVGMTLIFYAFLYFVNRLGYNNQFEQLKIELQRTKSQLLQHQLHPHFLYNAFNSLYSLSLQNHPETSKYILKLSTMMRYLTDDSQEMQVPLQKELNCIETYLAIERIRFGDHADIQFAQTGVKDTGILIAPFLLMTLVENAFKHGFYTNAREAFVHIHLQIQPNTINFKVVNKVFEKQHFQKSERKGTGLENLNQRLQLQYPNRFEFSHNIEEQHHIANLKLQLHE